MRTTQRLVRALLVGAVGALVAVLPVLPVLVAPASAAPRADATCTTSSGVTVLVQFPDGSTKVGCAPGDPKTGLTALKAAGFAYAFEAKTPGFVCTIDAKPADKDCLQSKYWGYFVGAGSAWKSADKGAKDIDPKPGEVQGWTFGTGKPPTTTLAKARGQVAPQGGSADQDRATGYQEDSDHSGPAWLWGAGFVVVVVLVAVGVTVARRRA